MRFTVTVCFAELAVEVFPSHREQMWGFFLSHLFCYPLSKAVKMNVFHCPCAIARVDDWIIASFLFIKANSARTIISICLFAEYQIFFGFKIEANLFSEFGLHRPQLLRWGNLSHAWKVTVHFQSHFLAITRRCWGTRAVLEHKLTMYWREVGIFCPRSVFEGLKRPTTLVQLCEVWNSHNIFCFGFSFTRAVPL